MAEAESSSQEQEQQSGGNGSDARKTALRAAAIAAASGATAIAARKAFSGGGEQQGGRSGGGSSSNGGGDSLMSGMLGSGLNAAKDSLLPFAEDAAHAAGEFLGANGPDFVRDTIVPAFIEGFQSAQQSGGD